MKPMFSEEYYRKNWDRFIKKVPGSDYINLEEELNHKMSIFKDLPEEAQKLLVPIKAQEVIEEATKLVYKEMATIKDLEAGKSSFGYTTQGQENQARYELRTRFDFNCLQLADFKKRYSA